jgi:hypothetical protein
MTTEMASSTSSDEDNDSWTGTDFSELDDPGLYVISSASVTTSSMATAPTTVAMSSRGHNNQ